VKHLFSRYYLNLLIVIVKLIPWLLIMRQRNIF